MTEQKILDYLKKNRKKGVAHGFMPEDVQIWCWTHKDEPIFNLYVSDGWSKGRTGITCCDTSIYCLPEDYKIKPKFKPHWEEFNIEDGVFRFNDEGYHYWEVEKFLSDYVGYFNAFGGWLYSGGGFWSTNTMIHSGCNLVDRTCDTTKDITPAIPTKIRFWRFKE